MTRRNWKRWPLAGLAALVVALLCALVVATPAVAADDEEASTPKVVNWGFIADGSTANEFLGVTDCGTSENANIFYVMLDQPIGTNRFLFELSFTNSDFSNDTFAVLCGDGTDNDSNVFYFSFTSTSGPQHTGQIDFVKSGETWQTYSAWKQDSSGILPTFENRPDGVQAKVAVSTYTVDSGDTSYPTTFDQIKDPTPVEGITDDGLLLVGANRVVEIASNPVAFAEGATFSVSPSEFRKEPWSYPESEAIAPYVMGVRFNTTVPSAGSSTGGETGGVNPAYWLEVQKADDPDAPVFGIAYLGGSDQGIMSFNYPGQWEQWPKNPAISNGTYNVTLYQATTSGEGDDVTYSKAEDADFLSTTTTVEFKGIPDISTTSFAQTKTAAQAAMTDAGATGVTDTGNMTLVVPVSTSTTGTQLSTSSYQVTVEQNNETILSTVPEASAVQDNGATHAFYFSLFNAGQWQNKPTYVPAGTADVSLWLVNSNANGDASENVNVKLSTASSVEFVPEQALTMSYIDNQKVAAEQFGSGATLPSTFKLTVDPGVPASAYAMQLLAPGTDETSANSTGQWNLSGNYNQEGAELTAALWSSLNNSQWNKLGTLTEGTYTTNLCAVSESEANINSIKNSDVPLTGGYLPIGSAEGTPSASVELKSAQFDAGDGTWGQNATEDFGEAAFHDKVLTAWGEASTLPEGVTGDAAAAALNVPNPTIAEGQIFAGWSEDPNESGAYTAIYGTPTIEVTPSNGSLFPKGSLDVTAQVYAASAGADGSVEKYPIAGATFGVTSSNDALSPAEATYTTGANGSVAVTVSASATAASGTEATLTFTLNKANDVEVTGVSDTATLNVVTVSASVSPALSGSATIEYLGGANGGQAKLAATPADGMAFKAWAGEDGMQASASNPWAVGVDEAGTYAAVFESAPAPSADLISVYRLWNPVTGEHLLSSDATEYKWLVANTVWTGEGVVFLAPEEGPVAVHRMYNPNNGDHVYSTSSAEQRALVAVGWKDEGECFSGLAHSDVPVMRLYNPAMTANGGAGNHLWTTDMHEYLTLPTLDAWQQEGVNWYAAALPQGSLD